MNSFAIRSSACWDPWVMMTLSAFMTRPAVLSLLASFSLSTASPSVIEYCSAVGPYFASTRSHAAAISATGKSSGAGDPPANAIIPGRDMCFRISRMAELLRFAIRSAYIFCP